MCRWPLALVAFTVACAAVTYRPLAIPPAVAGHVMHAGLNGSYHGRLDDTTLAYLAGLGDVTLRAAVETPEQATDILDSVAPFPSLHVLLLVERLDLGLVSRLTPVVGRAAAVELGNELDLGGATPLAFGDFVLEGRQTLRAGGFGGDVISGGIFAVQPGQLAWLRQAMASWPPDVLVGVHRYGDQTGYVDRADETRAIQAAAGGHGIAVTEFGYVSHSPADEAGLAQDMATDFGWFAALGASYAIVYQITDGPGAGNLDHFGLRTFPDGRWRPATAVLGTWSRK